MKLKDKDTTLPPKDALVAMLDRMEESGMSKTKQWSGMWQESLRYFFSDQLHGKKAHKNWDWIVLNYIWPSAIQEIAKLSKNNPKLIVNPWEQSDSDVAETWQNILQWQWQSGINSTGMRLEQIAAILDGKLYGYRVSKVYWENKCYWEEQQQSWMGDVKYRLWRPEYFWALGEEKIQDGPCGSVRWVTLDYAVKRWPKYKKELTQEANKFRDEFSRGNRTVRGQTSTSGTYPSAGTGGIDSGLGSVSENHVLNMVLRNTDQRSPTEVEEVDDFVKISEFYFYDYEEVKEKIEEDIPPQELIGTGQAYESNGNIFDVQSNEPIMPDSWPKRTVKEYNRPKYPTGRYIIKVGDTILNPDEQDQVYPYSRWPFVVTPHYLLPHMWQGSDAVQLYKSTQDMINVTTSHLVNNMKMFGDPKIAVESGAISAPPGRNKTAYKIGMGAGAIIRLVKGGLSRIKIIDPPMPSAAALQLYGLFTQEYKNIVGLQDIAQGKSTKNMTATEASYLALSSNDRIALQSVYEDAWVRGVATLIAEICQQNYDEGRYVRIVGEDESVGITEITQRAKSIRFDVDIIPGTTLPFDEEKRILKYERAMAQLAQPVPNPMLPEYLRALEIPGWQKILDKYAAWQQYVKFIQLYEAVKEGQVTPEQAVQLLIQTAMQQFQESQNSIEGAARQKQEQEQQMKENKNA